jgi:hypothetical protein
MALHYQPQHGLYRNDSQAFLPSFCLRVLPFLSLLAAYTPSHLPRLFLPLSDVTTSLFLYPSSHTFPLPPVLPIASCVFLFPPRAFTRVMYHPRLARVLPMAATLSSRLQSVHTTT